jgi:coenzyme F420-dependent glucose-6-phosphate dehydrogenase
MAQFGWKAGPEQYPPTELLDYAITADQAGFDFLDVSDHFHPWSEEGQACFTWTWLGGVAARTQQIQMGPGITCPILRYHPAVIAQAAATVAAMAPSRFYLGVGTGEALNEYAATGEWPGYNERRQRLSEAIELIRALWTGEEVTWDGDFYTTRKARLFTPPPSPIPIYVSTLVPESAAFAGRHGDGLISVGGQPDTLYQQMFESFEDGARQAGKDPTTMPRLIEIQVAYTDDEQAAIGVMQKYWAGTLVPALFNQKIYTPAMSAQNGQVVGADIIRQKACISADPEKQVQYARHYLDLGFDRPIFHSIGPDERAFLTGFGQDVLPRLRDQQSQQQAA